MADEAKGADAAHDAPKPSGGGGSLKWMIIAAAASLASAGGTFLVVSRSATQGGEAPAAAHAEKAESGHAEKAEEHEEEPEHKEAAAAPKEHEAEHGGGSEHGESEHGEPGHATSPSDSPAVFQMETFVVNINDGERDRFLKLKPELELSANGVSDELKANMPQVKDAIISLLSSQSFSQIRSIEGKDMLREEMQVRLNAMLRTGKVSRIFFTEFVVQ